MIGVETRKNVVLPPPSGWQAREKFETRRLEWEREREREGEREKEIRIFRLFIAFESKGDLEIRRKYRIGIIINIDY